MNELPPHWRIASIADLAGPEGLTTDGDWVESKDQDPAGEVRLIQLADIGDGVFLDRSHRFLTSNKARELRCTFLQPGDVLIARMPDPLGRACVFPGVGQPAVTAVDVFVWRGDSSGADAHWLMHTINSPEIRNEIASLASGTTRQRVSGGNLKRLELPAPSLTEQRSIATKLEGLLTRSRRAQEQLVRIEKLGTRWRESVLPSAFRGEVTSDNTKTWPSVKLGNLIASVEAGKNIRCEERPPPETERGIVKVSSVTWGTFNASAAKTPPADAMLNANTLIRPGDFLISRANTLELVGACVIVPDITNSNLYLSDKVLRIRFTEPVDEWVLHFLRSREGRRQIEDLATGNQLSMRNISQAALKGIRLPLPPQSIRNTILNRLRMMLSGLTRTLAEADRAARLISRLERALLAKAGRGDLVAQAEEDVVSNGPLSQTALLNLVPETRGRRQAVGA
jgi:type I restriction enzyme S subunit